MSTFSTDSPPFVRKRSRRLKTSVPKSSLENEENAKEWEEARCPVCMEHPHNAILLVCSSHDKGCRTFMCDTSYRHSNCFDQFRKSFNESPSTTLEENIPPTLEENIPPTLEENIPPTLEENIPPLVTSVLPLSSMLSSEATNDGHVGSHLVQAESSETHLKPKLVCPLCRGQVKDWIVVESARKFMNEIPRSCASETCDYSGTYNDLRKHARQIHPLVRPADADPERQRKWRRLEGQRDLGDLLSTLQTSIQEESTEDSTSTFDEGGWLTVLLLVRILRPGSSPSSSSSPVASRTRGAQVMIRRRSSRRLWGDTYDWESDSRDTNNEASDDVPEP